MVLVVQLLVVQVHTRLRARITDAGNQLVGALHLLDAQGGVLARYRHLLQADIVVVRAADGVGTQVQGPVLTDTLARDGIQETHNGCVRLRLRAGSYRSTTWSIVVHSRNISLITCTLTTM